MVQLEKALEPQVRSLARLIFSAIFYTYTMTWGLPKPWFTVGKDRIESLLFAKGTFKKTPSSTGFKSVFRLSRIQIQCKIKHEKTSNWTATILSKNGNNCWTESWNKPMPRWQLPMCNSDLEMTILAAFGITKMAACFKRMMEDYILVYIHVYVANPWLGKGSHHFWFINFLRLTSHRQPPK